MNTKVFDLQTDYESAMKAAARVIREGGLVVFPTETVYGLGADAMNPIAVKKIFEAKGRPQDNPLIVHIGDMKDVFKLAAEVSPMARRLMNAFWPGPFTAVVRHNGMIPGIVTAGLDSVGIRMPLSKPARDLIRESGRFIAAPSANLSGKPSPTRAAHVIDDLMGKVDVILSGEDCDIGLESTVCSLTGEIPVVLRPGGITPEMIREVAGEVQVSPAVLSGLPEGQKAASPGMKYKHYSPKAKVYVADGKNAKTIAIKVNSRYDIDKNEGRMPVIICPAEDQALYEGKELIALGSGGMDGVAGELFDALRRSDALGADVVYFHAVEAKGLGLAVMNRVMRAAEFDVI